MTVDVPGGVELAYSLDGLTQRVLDALDAAGVRWCLTRAVAGGGDVDVLVHPADRSRAYAVLRAQGLWRLRAYGRGSHAFFLGRDSGSGGWVEFDVVTDLAFGRCLELRTGAAEACLARRRRVAGTWLLAADDEFWSLLLHCVFDKSDFARRHTDRLARLPAIGSGALVRALPPGVTDEGLEELVRAGRWDALVAAGPAIRRAWWRAGPVGVAAAVVRARALRLVERPLQVPSRRGAAVALLGPDGCGKSTVAARVAGAFPLPVRRVYMGLWADGEPDGRLRHAARVVRRPFTVWRRYATGLRHRALGRLVIFDRYTYDALLSPRGSWRRLKRLYFLALSRSCPRPDLVILLDAPGWVMHARSGEYDAAHLERERREFAAVADRLPGAVRVNADRPVDAVAAEVAGHIWNHYRARSSR